MQHWLICVNVALPAFAEATQGQRAVHEMCLYFNLAPLNFSQNSEDPFPFQQPLTKATGANQQRLCSSGQGTVTVHQQKLKSEPLPSENRQTVMHSPIHVSVKA